jgi:FkbM family methyltransferase
MTVRRTLEVLTRSWRFKRHLPPEFGGAALWVSPAGGLRYLFKRMRSIDPELLRLAAEVVRTGDVVWDVGANVGLFSVASASLAGASGRVIAYEPDDWLVGLLRRSAKSRGPIAAPITIVPVAIAQDVELRTFCIAKRARATNFLAGYGTTQTGGIAEQRSVMAVPLDWLSKRLPTPNVLKIDVEGAELEVLKGATSLLTVARPIILCEVGLDTSLEVASLLKKFDYVVCDGAIPISDRSHLNAAPLSTLAFPSEMLGAGAPLSRSSGSDSPTTRPAVVAQASTRLDAR